MRKLWVVVTGLLCFVAQGAHSQSFEQQVQQISQKVSGAALQTRQAMAASHAAAQGCGKGCGSAINPADALDEAKVGVAAKFVPVEAGEFEMGSPTDQEGRYNDEVQHRVKLTKDFEMQATEVTQLQYFLVMGRNPSTFRKQENCDADNFKVVAGVSLCVNHPVEYVSWDDAQKFIEELNRIQNKYTYRLPKEEEWEYAARGGTPLSSPSPFPFPCSRRCNDMKKIGDHGWYDGNSGGRTHAVASKKANELGLYDVSGNVWEWTQDWYDDPEPAGRAPLFFRVFRGGSWSSAARDLRSARRNGVAADYRYYALGLRLVRSSR